MCFSYLWFIWFQLQCFAVLLWWWGYCYIRGLHHVISVQCRIESQRNVRVMNKILILEEKAINKVIPYNTN